MGLTIWYEFRSAASPEEARKAVRALRKEAMKLSFDAVGDLCELDPSRASDEGDEAIQWLKLSGTHYLERATSSGETEYLPVEPAHVVRFSVRTAGAESALIGLASHPAVVRHSAGGKNILIETDLTGCYTWHSGCKTQYASLPRHGGVDNFLRAHLSLVALLDRATDLGIEVTVRDDGRYWATRDERILLEHLRDWNGLVAAVSGKLKDTLGPHVQGEIVAPIASHPAFEHLEADGLRRLVERSSQTLNDPPQDDL